MSIKWSGCLLPSAALQIKTDKAADYACAPLFTTPLYNDTSPSSSFLSPAADIFIIIIIIINHHECLPLEIDHDGSGATSSFTYNTSQYYHLHLNRG